jgi:hypothetical protein
MAGCCPNILFACPIVFCINLRLAKGNDKTRLRLKQLSLLIFRFAKIVLQNAPNGRSKGYFLGNSPMSYER